MPGRNLEHVYRHPAQECPQPADQHWGGRPHSEAIAQNELCGWHDRRWVTLFQSFGIDLLWKPFLSISPKLYKSFTNSLNSSGMKDEKSKQSWCCLFLRKMIFTNKISRFRFSQKNYLNITLFWRQSYELLSWCSFDGVLLFLEVNSCDHYKLPLCEKNICKYTLKYHIFGHECE